MFLLGLTPIDINIQQSVICITLVMHIVML